MPDLNLRAVRADLQGDEIVENLTHLSSPDAFRAGRTVTVEAQDRRHGCCPSDPQAASVMVHDMTRIDLEALVQRAETAASIVARAQLEPGWELDRTHLGEQLALLLDTIHRQALGLLDGDR